MMTNTNYPAMPPVRLPSIDALSDPDALVAVVGPVASIERSPLVALGYTYTGNTLERLDLRLVSGGRRKLVLKRTATTLNWVERRSGDAVGREAALLAEPALSGVWEVLGCPYRAYAAERGDAGLLMEDLSDHLLPDIDEPIAVADEDALLAALAALHARYWESDVLRLPWLAAPAIRFALLGPMASTEEAGWPEPGGFFDDVRRGWEMAFSRLPPHVKDLLSRPASVLAADCASLPWTLLHGDAKVANFALLPGRRVAAFDWQLLGVGPATLDLGWYLAVNSSRLARPKEQVIARYRDLLESRLTRPLSNLLWERMVAVGVMSGALMLLWAKALSLEESGSPQAAEEWNWWVTQLRHRV
jgi:Phosphotransferase enzyme family